MHSYPVDLSSKVYRNTFVQLLLGNALIHYDYVLNPEMVQPHPHSVGGRLNSFNHSLML